MTTWVHMSSQQPKDISTLLDKFIILEGITRGNYAGGLLLYLASVYNIYSHIHNGLVRTRVCML